MWNEIKSEQDALIQKINNFSLEEKIDLVREIVEDTEFNYVYNCVIELNEIKKSLLGKEYKDARFFEPTQFAFDDFEKAAKTITSKYQVMKKHSKDGIDHYPGIGQTVIRFYSSYLLAKKHLDNVMDKIKTECPNLCGVDEDEEVAN